MVALRGELHAITMRPSTSFGGMVSIQKYLPPIFKWIRSLLNDRRNSLYSAVVPGWNGRDILHVRKNLRYTINIMLQIYCIRYDGRDSNKHWSYATPQGFAPRSRLMQMKKQYSQLVICEGFAQVIIHQHLLLSP